MRSFASTLILALIAAVLCGMAGWQWQRGNFDSIFGAPPTPVGQRLYTSFTANEVKHIRISGSGNEATFSLEDKGWQASTPWADRMDPRAAVGIINFTLGMRVEDLADADEIAPDKSGLNKNATTIRLENADHLPLANYKLGRTAPWKAEFEGIEQPVPTVFVQQRDKNRKRHVYACTGDINSLFKDGLKFLRDHRPFYFNPLSLQKIRIRSQKVDLILGRADPKSPWRIVTPLDLPTDPAVMKTLIEGIFEMQAVKVSDRSSVTLPAADNAATTSQIALTQFGSEDETLLEIFPAETPDAHVVKATVSDRPDTVFDLPLKPEPGFVSLANLPLSVNELRDPTLTHLNIASLRGISIRPATGTEIVVTLESPTRWTVDIDGVSTEANEENLYSLLKAVTTGKATAFVSDAATDFSPWGLDRPILTLRFLGLEGQANQAIELRFGIDGKGGYFVNRLGTPTVMKVDEALISSIAVRPFEWRHSRLWSVDRFNLVAMKLARGEESPLILKYNFTYESWIAERDGKDLTASLDPAKANYMLSVIEGLKVSRWLATTDENAIEALKKPSLTLTVTEFTKDADDEVTGVQDRTITLAPAAPGKNPGFYYGRLDKEEHPFLLDRPTYQNIAEDLFEKQIPE